MKYKNKDSLKENAVQLYLEGKTYIEISKVLGISRTFASKLIKNDIRVIEKKKILKVSKTRPKNLIIRNTFLNKIGITNNPNIDEYVEISVNTKDNSILVKKYIK